MQSVTVVADALTLCWDIFFSVPVDVVFKILTEVCFYTFSRADSFAMLLLDLMAIDHVD